MCCSCNSSLKDWKKYLYVYIYAMLRWQSLVYYGLLRYCIENRFWISGFFVSVELLRWVPKMLKIVFGPGSFAPLGPPTRSLPLDPILPALWPITSHDDGPLAHHHEKLEWSMLFKHHFFNYNSPLLKGCAGERIGTKYLRPWGTSPLKGASLIVGDV